MHARTVRFNPLQFDSLVPIACPHLISVPHGFIHYLHFCLLCVSHVRSCDRAHEHDTFEKLYYSADFEHVAS